MVTQISFFFLVDCSSLEPHISPLSSARQVRYKHSRGTFTGNIEEMWVLEFYLFCTTAKIKY